ncbi:MAG: OmpP1/FadL family transporter [bacterium]
MTEVRNNNRIKRAYFISLLVLCGAVLFFTAHVMANGVLLESIGTMSTGRGATNIAYSDNGTMVYDNPAGLAHLTKDTMEFSTEFLSFSMHYKDPQNDEEGSEPVCILPSLFYMKHFNDRPLGIGVGIFSSAGYSTEYDLSHPLYGTQDYSSYSSLSKILIGAGYKINDHLSVGLSVGPSYSKVELKLPYTFQTDPLAQIPVPALIDLKADGWSYTWNIGAQWDISAQSTVGIIYKSKDLFDMQGDLDMDIPALAAQTSDTSAHYDLDFDFKWPQSVGVGVLQRLTEKHRLSFDCIWIDWSSAFDKVVLKLSKGDNDYYNTNPLVGTSPRDTLPLDWKDSYSFRLGYEQLLTPKDTLRCGYLYSQSPVPDRTLTPLIPGILNHMISVGYSREIKNWRLSVAYLYAFCSKQSVEESAIIGDDFDASSVKESLHCVSVGVAYQL